MNLSLKYVIIISVIFVILVGGLGFITIYKSHIDTIGMDIEPGEGICGIKIDNTGIILGKERDKRKRAMADTCVGGVYDLKENENVSGVSCIIRSLRYLYVTSGNFSAAYTALKGNSEYEYAIAGWMKVGESEWVSPGNYFYEYSDGDNSEGWSRIRTVNGPNGEEGKDHSYSIDIDTGNVNGYIDEKLWFSRPGSLSRISSMEFIGERTENNGNNDSIFPGTNYYAKEKFLKTKYESSQGWSYVPTLTFYSQAKYAALDYSGFNLPGECSFDIWDSRF